MARERVCAGIQGRGCRKWAKTLMLQEQQPCRNKLTTCHNFTETGS